MSRLQWCYLDYICSTEGDKADVTVGPAHRDHTNTLEVIQNKKNDLN